MLTTLSLVQSLYCRYLSKPAFNRPVYRAIHKHHLRTIVELGVGTGQRAVRMIQTARLASPASELRYVGLDRFEDRTESDGSGLSLKAAHQLLRGVPAHIQLIPGPPAEMLIRMANSLGKVDLLLIPAAFDEPEFARFWRFVPRMLHEGSVVFVERPGENGQRQLAVKSRLDIDQQAVAVAVRRAA
jgi:hypothetical protein